MLNQFIDIIESDFNSFRDKNIFLAISGGKDSMTLSHLLLECNIDHTLLHCNFKLRVEDSDTDERFVKEYALKNNLNFRTIEFNTKNYAETHKLTIQEAARNLRYDWFKTVITNNDDIILTAHHQDDNIETFFINLMRGTSIKGLTGISARTNNVYRPFLKFTQTDILNYIKEKSIPFRQDQSNFDSKYLRNDIRKNIIPLIEAKSDNFKQKVNQTMESITALNTWVETLAIDFKIQNFQVLEHDIIQVKIELLLNQADIFKEYILKEYNIHRSNLGELNKFLHSSTGAVFKTTSHTFYINRKDLLIQKKYFVNKAIAIQIDQLPFELIHSNFHIKFLHLENLNDFSKTNNPQFLDFDKINLPLILRKWKQGDKIQPLGMNGNKLISDILIDKKITLLEKERIYVIESNSKIVAIINLMISETVKVTEQTKSVLSIERS